jgi:acyl-coenzyme A synthetase/AMP-(fatty) acid ligase
MIEAFVRSTERGPEKLCLRFEGDEWTYGRLHQRAIDFAAALRTWGLRPRDRVALYASYKKPRRVVFVDALPRIALGKVLKHEVLRELIEAEE